MARPTPWLRIRMYVRTSLLAREIFVSGKRVFGGSETKAPKGRPSDTCAVSETGRVRDNAANPRRIREPPGNLRKTRTAWWRRQSQSNLVSEVRFAENREKYRVNGLVRPQNDAATLKK